MRIASLDLGSNSFLCLIVDVDGDKISSVICDESRVVRLSEGVQQSGRLSDVALERARLVLTEFKKIITTHKVDKIISVTTAVARQASNSKFFLDMVSAFQFPIQLLSGEEEAGVTYLGAISGSTESDNILVIDIGGGSTEIIFDRDNAKSFDFGVVRIKEKFNIQYPINTATTNDVSKYIDNEINEFLSILRLKKIRKVVAVAGTPTTLAAIEIGRYDPKIVDGYSFSIENLESWYDKLSQLEPDRIVSVYFVEPGRADVISIGVLILIRILRLLDLTSMEVSIRGVRYGVVLKALKDKSV
jgi:exopolyphosphatase/guanosine-5'-triphosphate,3'-diphosphate pyrophosphatase